MESGVFPVFSTRELSNTLYAVGKAIEEDPDVGISSVNRHDVASHAYRWIDYAHMTPEKEKAYIKKEIETVTKISGSPPEGWYYDEYQADLSL